MGTVPAGPVGPDVTVDRIQPVAEGPVGQSITRRQVGTDGMFSSSDSDQPTADGPVGRFITHSPVGPDIMLSTCDPDRPVADGPVGQSFILGPVGPRMMSSLYELNIPVAVGPVGQPFTTGPVGTHESVSNCKRMDRIADSPVGSTEIPDPAKQTESPIQTDFMKIGTTSEPAGLGDTPPSSDSGVHSLGEQWENMSTSSIDMESEQNDRPTNGCPKGRHESDENSSIDIQQDGRKIQYNDVTICENENSSVNSGTYGGNSDIGVLADLSDGDEESILFDRPVTESATAWAERDSHGPSDEYWENSGRPVTEAMTEMAGNDANIFRDDYSDFVDQLVRETLRSGAESGEPQTKQYYGCRIPDCQCDGSIEMEWGSVDMTETDDSEYEDPDDRANRLCVEESLNSEPTVQPGTVADEYIPTHGDEGDTYEPNELTGWTEVLQTFPVGNIQNLSTDGSRSQ